MLKNHELEDTDKFVEPTKTYEPEKDMAGNLFVYVPKIDHDAFLKYTSSQVH